MNPDPGQTHSLFDYVGAIGGIIGTLGGILGSVLGYIGYRRVEQYKALDLRLELRKAELTLRSDIEGLVPQLELAKRSRERLAASRGNLGSGATQAWLAEWETDIAEAREMSAAADNLGFDGAGFTHTQLEERLVKIHVLNRKVTDLAGKYQAALAQDDRDRARLADELQDRKMLVLRRALGDG